MTPTLLNPPRFRLRQSVGPHIELASDDDFKVHIFVLEQEIIRIAVLRGERFSMPRTWSIAAGEEDVAEDGRDRFDVGGFSRPEYELRRDEQTIEVVTERLRLSIDLAGLKCRWDMNSGDGWRTIARDRPTQAYNFGWWGPKIHHYLVRASGERYFGLGERTGDMDRALRRFRLSGVDAMGYNAKSSDPLYKHIPFYITHDQASLSAFGIFYDTYADCEFDFGAEVDNYHGPYRSFIAESGDLDYYVIAGPTIADVTKRFTWLTGRPALPPKWSLGYSGSTMSYTDAENAQTRMSEFIDKCRTHDILCDSFHLSSGYSSIGDQRHVFHWNRTKFPDPDAFTRSFHDAGLKLCANIKPCLLTGNPLFEEARRSGFLIQGGNGEPAWTQFWSGIGAYIDFTNPAARQWWREQVKTRLLAHGIDATWNDNNEFEIRSPDAVAHGFEEPWAAVDCKPLQSLLMMRSSRDAQREFDPARRPFLVSRSGAAGMQRYAQTWSGDNFTSWETLQYNIKMGLGLALCGVSNSGHDVGGFAGPAPDVELFMRWIEAGIFMPRFSIHSWNSDGTVNEPWMYADATPLVRQLIAFRYALVPYLYDLMWRYHAQFEPVWRPTSYDFPDDPRCVAECDSFMLGPALLVAPVCQPGTRRLDVYLPAGSSWVEYWSGARFAGGAMVEADAPLGRPILFAREGAAIAMNVAEQNFGTRPYARGFAIFPPRIGTLTASQREDDGESEAWRTGGFGSWHLELECAETLKLCATPTGALLGSSPALTLLFRPGETRPVELARGKLVSDFSDANWRRVAVDFDD